MAKAIRYTISVTALYVLDDDAQDCTAEEARLTARENHRIALAMNEALAKTTGWQCDSEILETDVIDVTLSPRDQKVDWSKLPADPVL
jgi:hypothetical protein